MSKAEIARFNRKKARQNINESGENDSLEKCEEDTEFKDTKY
jgi:hypothetical protein